MFGYLRSLDKGFLASGSHVNDYSCSHQFIQTQIVKSPLLTNQSHVNRWVDWPDRR